MSSILVNLYVPPRQELSLLKNPGLQLQKEVPGKFMQIFLSPQSTPVHSLISVQQLKDESGLRLQHNGFFTTTLFNQSLCTAPIIIATTLNVHLNEETEPEMDQNLPVSV